MQRRACSFELEYDLRPLIICLPILQRKDAVLILCTTRGLPYLHLKRGEASLKINTNRI